MDGLGIIADTTTTRVKHRNGAGAAPIVATRTAMRFVLFNPFRIC
jgi:hypothetical protein